MAAAHDCQEGGDLLEQALFAPAKVGVFDVAQCVERAQTQSKQSGLGLKMNKSGTTNDDWQRFLCIEPVLVNRPSVLQPGEGFDGGLGVEVQANSTAAFN
jgi:hypothetical protein